MAMPSGQNLGAESRGPELKGCGSQLGNATVMSCERYSMDSRSTLVCVKTSHEPSGESAGLATPVR